MRYFLGRQKVCLSLSVNTLHDNGRQCFILQAKLMDFSGNATCIYALRARQQTVGGGFTYFSINVINQYFKGHKLVKVASGIELQ